MTEDQVRDLAQVIIAVIVGLISYFGILKGRAQSSSPANLREEVMELKGAVISDKKADEIIESIDNFGRHVTRLQHMLDDLQLSFRNANNESKDDLREMQRDIRDLIREMKSTR